MQREFVGDKAVNCGARQTVKGIIGKQVTDRFPIRPVAGQDGANFRASAHVLVQADFRLRQHVPDAHFINAAGRIFTFPKSSRISTAGADAQIAIRMPDVIITFKPPPAHRWCMEAASPLTYRVIGAIKHTAR